MSFFIIGNGKDKAISLLRNSLPNIIMRMFPCAKALNTSRSSYRMSGPESHIYSTRYKMPTLAYKHFYTLRKRDVIISAIKSRLKRTSHKYGIEVPTSVKHALELDDVNGIHLWRDLLSKEMHNVGIAFSVLDAGQDAPIGWSKESGHIIYNVKMDFTRKARWVLDGHKTANPIGSTYAGVASRESV
jgi:hypothetical protein